MEIFTPTAFYRAHSALCAVGLAACNVGAPHEPAALTSPATVAVPAPPTASVDRLTAFVTCPAGALQVGGSPPEATERLCVTPPNEREGRYTRWYENGRFAEEVDYRHGLQEGRSVSWTDDGLPREAGTYVAGRKNGLWTTWQYGKLAFTGEFVDDLQHGSFAAYDRDTATLSAVGAFRYGEPCGRFACYTPEGSPTACTALEGKCPTTATGGECPPCEQIPRRAPPPSEPTQP